MINYKNLLDFHNSFIKDIPVPDRYQDWINFLEITENDSATDIIIRATISCSCNFNYWEEDGKISWPAGVNGIALMDALAGRRSMQTLNLYHTRAGMYNRIVDWLEKRPIDINSKKWWAELSIEFGHDPLRKRETLLFIILSDLGLFDKQSNVCPNVGCIDYNVITALRFHGVIEGYEGNIFDEETETQLRTECLSICQFILQLNKSIDISGLDYILYNEGRRIRYNEPEWEKFFCYRYGCYFY